MGHPSKPTCSSLTMPENRVRLPTSSIELYSPATHTPFTSSSYTVAQVVEPSHNLSVDMHPYFTFSDVPSIVWNVTLPCASITTADLQCLTPQALSELATNPPCSTLTIISFRLPWSIEVRASSPEPGAYVTVSDVVSTVHRALQLAVTPFEFSRLSSREVQGRIVATFMSRIREGGGQGVKRVDYLMGANRFMGLSGMQFRPGVWALNLS